MSLALLAGIRFVPCALFDAKLCGYSHECLNLSQVLTMVKIMSSCDDVNVL